MRHPLTTKRYSHEYLDSRLRTCIQRYLLATQPPFEDPPETFTAWAEALAWQAYTPEQQATLRTIGWTTQPPTVLTDSTTVTICVSAMGLSVADLLGISIGSVVCALGAYDIPICVPVNRDQLVLPLCSDPTVTVRHIHGTSAYVQTTPLEPTLAGGLNRYFDSRTPASSPADALRPPCLDTYPWDSRLTLATRLIDARRLLRTYMMDEPMPLRQLLTLCPELRPTAADLKAHRWTRTDAVREYAHVTGAQRTEWTEAINCYIRTTEHSTSITPFRDLDDLRATLIPVMAHAQMTGGNQ